MNFYTLLCILRESCAWDAKAPLLSSPGRASSQLHSHFLLYTDSSGTTLPCVSDPSQHVQDWIPVWLMRRGLKYLMLDAVEKCCKHSCNWSALKNWFCVKQQRKFKLYFVAQECLQYLRGKIRGKALSWQRFSFEHDLEGKRTCPQLCAWCCPQSKPSGEERGAGGCTELLEQLTGFSWFSCAQLSAARMDRKATNICRRGKVKREHKEGKSATQVTKTERTGDYLCCALSVLRTGDSRDNTKASLLWIYELVSHFVVTALSKSLFVPEFLKCILLCIPYLLPDFISVCFLFVRQRIQDFP